MSDTVFQTYRAGVSRGTGIKVHAMTQRWSLQVGEGYVALCGTGNLLLLSSDYYDDTQSTACRRCHNLRRTEIGGVS